MFLASDGFFFFNLQRLVSFFSRKFIIYKWFYPTYDVTRKNKCNTYICLYDIVYMCMYIYMYTRAYAFIFFRYFTIELMQLLRTILAFQSQSR